MSLFVIIPAAGSGRRMGAERPKQYLPVCGKPVLVWTVRAFAAHPAVAGIVVAVPAGDEEKVQALLAGEAGAVNLRIVAGGAARQESVCRALAELPAECDVVLVHDAARPLVPREVIDRVIAAAAKGAVTAALPVSETIKVVEGTRVVSTPDRATLWSVQTPQGFPRALLERAHREGRGAQATDDCALVEMLGEQVIVVPGAAENIKITTPADLPVAEMRLAAKAEAARAYPGVGLGYDVHRLVTGRPLFLGGVEIPHTHGLLGHSDADVLLHAIMDALLGAAGLGDIGHHFPDKDPAYAGASSLGLLREVDAKLAANGLRALGVDAVLIAERPRISPYVPMMRAKIAEALHLPTEAVNVKATTNEKLGFPGREEGMAAQAIARVGPSTLGAY